MNKITGNNVTLDKKHTEMLEDFKHNQEILIPKYNSEINRLNKFLNNTKNKTKYEKVEITENRIKELKNTIYMLEKKKKDYMLNNSKYIFNYFEDKKNITCNETKVEINNTKINQFFYLDEKVEKPAPVNDERTNIIDKYFYNINNSHINYDNYCYQSDICTFCNKGEMVYAETEGTCICNNCSRSVKYLIENEKPSYKEPPKEVCFYAYKRINHLREILAQFQAKESTHIPTEVFENIKTQIKKERLEIKDLTNKKQKRF